MKKQIYTLTIEHNTKPTDMPVTMTIKERGFGVVFEFSGKTVGKVIKALAEYLEEVQGVA